MREHPSSKACDVDLLREHAEGLRHNATVFQGLNQCGRARQLLNSASAMCEAADELQKLRYPLEPCVTTYTREQITAYLLELAADAQSEADNDSHERTYRNVCSKEATMVRDAARLLGATSPPDSGLRYAAINPGHECKVESTPPPPEALQDDDYVFADGHYANCGVYEGRQRGPCSCSQIYEQNRASQQCEPFVVKHYAGDERPSIKGNGFDGLEIGEDRQQAEEFIAWINARVVTPPKVCGTCNGQGVIGGFVNMHSGYQMDPCPDCTAQPPSACRSALQDIVDKYDMRAELYTNDADCAGNLADVARLALTKS